MTDQVQGSDQGELFAEPYDPMDMGAYEAELQRIFTPTEDGPFGPSREWYFKILDEDYKGRVIKKFTSQSFAPSSTQRMYVEALLGRAVEDGERLQFSELTGLPCILHIGHKRTERGTFETVESISPIRRRRGGAGRTQEQPPPDTPRPPRGQQEEIDEENPPF